MGYEQLRILASAIFIVVTIEIMTVVVMFFFKDDMSACIFVSLSLWLVFAIATVYYLLGGWI